MLNLFFVLFVFYLSREYILLNEELFFIFSFVLFFFCAFNFTASLFIEVLDQKAEEIFTALAFSYKQRQNLLIVHKKYLAANLQFLTIYLDLLSYAVAQVCAKGTALNTQPKAFLFALANQQLKNLLNMEFVLQRAFLNKVGILAIKNLYFRLTTPFYVARQYPGTYFYVFDKYVYGFTPFILEHMFSEQSVMRNMFCFRSRFLLIALALRFKKPFMIFIK